MRYVKNTNVQTVNKLKIKENYKEFETRRLIIKPTSIEDADLIYLIMNAPKFMKYVGDRKINSIQDAKEYIQNRMLPQLYSVGYSNYSIIIKKNEKKIGICGLYHREGIDGVDLGFGLLPEYEGFGYAYEASKQLVNAAFKEFGFQEIKAITAKGNYASQKLLKRLGFEFKGLTNFFNDTEEYLYRIKRSA